MPRGHPILCRELAELVADLLAKRWRKGEIKTLLAKEFNDGEPFHRSTIERLLRMARVLILARSKASQAEHKAEAIALYEMVIRDETASWKDKMSAQAALRELLGLDHKYTPIDDVGELAGRLRGALAEMDESVPSTNGTVE